MMSTIGDNALGLDELQKMAKEADSKVNSLSASIESLEKENKRLEGLKNSISTGWNKTYEMQYNNNLALLKQLKLQLTEWQYKQKQYNDALAEAGKDNDVPTDDYYRIPAIMADLRTSFNLTWQGSGSWSGYTYTRKATMPNIDGVITFKATLSIARKPKYFLGIKIHRAILQISWELTTMYSNTQVIDVLNLDPNKSEKEKADEVNKRISEIAREYPDCQITTEYAKSTPTEDTTTDDTYHLLWSSDRLEIAREVDSRITKIYSDLVILEKFMHYKHNIIDMLLNAVPIDYEQGRHRTLLDEAFHRWRENGKLKDERNPIDNGKTQNKPGTTRQFDPDGFTDKIDGTVDLRRR